MLPFSQIYWDVVLFFYSLQNFNGTFSNSCQDTRDLYSDISRWHRYKSRSHCEILHAMFDCHCNLHCSKLFAVSPSSKTWFVMITFFFKNFETSSHTYGLVGEGFFQQDRQNTLHCLWSRAKMRCHIQNTGDRQKHPTGQNSPHCLWSKAIELRRWRNCHTQVKKTKTSKIRCIACDHRRRYGATYKTPATA